MLAACPKSMSLRKRSRLMVRGLMKYLNMRFHE